VEEAQPRVIVLENVAGLQFSGKDEGVQLLRSRINEINRKTRSNYQPFCTVLKAAEHGVPQLRERFFLVAARDGSSFTFPAPSFSPPRSDNTLVQLPLYRTAWDALGDLPEPAEELAMQG